MVDRVERREAPQVRSALVVVGTGCLFFIFMSSLTGMVSEGYAASLSPAWVYGIALVIVAMLLTAACLSRGDRLRRRVYRVFLVVASVLAACWVALAVLLGSGALSDGLRPVALDLFEMSRLVFTALFGVLWSLHISLNEPRDASRVICAAMLFAAALMMVALAGDANVTVALDAVAAAVSAALLAVVARRYTFEPTSAFSLDVASSRLLEAPTPLSADTAAQVRFFLARIGWSVAAALLLGAVGTFSYPGRECGVGLLLSALAALVVAIVVFASSPTKLSAIVMAAGTVVLVAVLPLVPMGGDAPLSLVVALPTMAWYTLFFIQLPTYRAVTRLDPLLFAFLQALVPVAAVYALRLAAALFVNDTGALFWGVLASPAVAWLFLGASVALCAGVLVRHMLLYCPEGGVGADAVGTGASPAFGRGDGLARLEARYGLTPREAEVLYYLARGYSRPYVAKALCVSLATVKTHANNLYRKLSVASQNELIDLVRRS